MELRKRRNEDGSTSYFIDYRLDGHRRRKVLKNVKDKKSAEVALAKFQIRVAREEVGLPTRPDLTVATCLKAYREAKEATLSPKAYKTLKARAAQIEKYFGKDLPVRAVNEKAVNAFRRALRDGALSQPKKDKDGKEVKPKGDSPWTINVKVALLKAAVARAVKRNWIAKNPLADLERLSDPRADKWRFLTNEEAERLLTVLREGGTRTIERKGPRGNYKYTLEKNERLHRLAVFLLNTGARLGEAQAVTWRDVDLKQGIVRLNTTKAASKGRTAKMRFIPMNAALRELLETMPKASGPLFPYAFNLNRAFEAACKVAGLGHVRIHDLRHTFASTLAMAGVPLNTIRELLGHATMTMTLRYAHLAPNVTAEAVEALNFGAKRTVATVVSVAENVG